MRRPPTSRPRATAPPSSSRPWPRTASSPQRPRPRPTPPMSASSKPANQNSVRYFTDWALPQLDTLIDETSRSDRCLDHARSRHAGRRRQGDRRQCARGRARRAGRDRPRRRRAGDGRRQGLCQFDLQPRDPVAAPARFGVQAVRLSGGARIGDEADRHGGRRTGDHRWLEPAQRQPHFVGPVSLREAFSRSINTISAKIGAQVGFSTIADMARRFGITTPISAYPAMVLDRARSG